MKDTQQKLYPSCKNFTKLSFVVELYQIRCLHDLRDKVIISLIKLFKKVFHDSETLPNNFHEVKKIITNLDLSYEKTYAYENNYMLFWKEHSNGDKYCVCGESR